MKNFLTFEKFRKKNENILKIHLMLKSFLYIRNLNYFYMLEKRSEFTSNDFIYAKDGKNL